jgi:hypothetical protein
MFDNNHNKDNTILIDVNSRKNNKQQKINCVLCKIELTCINLEEKRFKCPRCKNSYQLGYEIIPQENILESSHESSDYEEYVDNEGLLVADNDLDFDDNNDDEYDRTKSDIKVPKYMKSSTTTEVIEYREE